MLDKIKLFLSKLVKDSDNLRIKDQMEVLDEIINISTVLKTIKLEYYDIQDLQDVKDVLEIVLLANSK